MEELQPSLMKNVTGGSGCGCGCIGMLVALAGALVLGAIPLGMYLDPSAAPYGIGLSLVVGGLMLAGLGVVIWLVSIFMD
jgi:hypothetical protein